MKGKKKTKARLNKNEHKLGIAASKGDMNENRDRAIQQAIKKQKKKKK